MKIGLLDVEARDKSKVKFPNLALMKISAYHKSLGDEVEWLDYFQHYDKVYVSKIFGDEYSHYEETCINAKEVIYGGTGFAVSIENGKEVYHKDKDKDLHDKVEHCYPDYELYPALTQKTAYGFLSRGCPRDCSFCIVTEKEGRCSHKVADLSEFWRGQTEIKLLDPNLLACPDREELLEQLAESGSWVDFTQGLDARFLTKDVALLLKTVRVKRYHFAWDFISESEKVLRGLNIFREIVKPSRDLCFVYILTNFDTTFMQDYQRVKTLQKMGLPPDVRIYRKETAPEIVRHLQGWCNNRIIYRAEPDFFKYIPHRDGKTIAEKFPREYQQVMEWAENDEYLIG